MIFCGVTIQIKPLRQYFRMVLFIWNFTINLISGTHGKLQGYM